MEHAHAADLPERSSFWSWVALVGLATIHVAAVVVLSSLLALGSQGVCGDPASPGELEQVRVALGFVLAISAALWSPAVILAVRRRRHVARRLVATVVVLLVPAWVLAQALAATPADWSTDWCLF